MCGIVGYVGKRDAGPILMEGLHRTLAWRLEQESGSGKQSEPARR